MFDTIAPRYDLVNRLMTFRLDVHWRKVMVDAIALAPGRRVVDVAAGTGDLCRELQRRGIRPVGIDLSLGMLAAAPHPFDRVHCDALRMPLRSASMDGATCGFALRNFVDLPTLFAELSRVVAPGGRIGLLDVAEPTNPVLAIGHRVYFGKVAPAIGSLLSNGDAYRYLPRSVAYLPPASDICVTLEDHGFENVRHRMLTGGIAQLFTATRTPT